MTTGVERPDVPPLAIMAESLMVLLDHGLVDESAACAALAIFDDRTRARELLALMADVDPDSSLSDVERAVLTEGVDEASRVLATESAQQ